MQGVGGSSPLILTKGKALKTLRFQGFSFFTLDIPKDRKTRKCQQSVNKMSTSVNRYAIKSHAERGILWQVLKKTEKMER